ncbi:Uncharacterised protein [Mycobacteroides abscessus subsp. abscessus]|uniref:hypothetical protein n=1 Tax=Mycobacteroides abscessus TaxID=36809 RepID=UPI00092C96B8|nr:hypothetical protein [Mycobacteroides abscessus]SIJ21192.1 Uncharacterised protein [Mycobacteroides abscessus subsp. abscessus]SLH39298.1 Uncharacterised protein [Mycobacteroides abscessus subsp. abscessus]
MKQEPTRAGRRLAGGIPVLQGREDVKWPGHLDSPDRVVEFFGQPVEAADVKVLCSGAEGGGVALLISGPGGLSASASQKADGSQVSDVTVKGSGEPKVLAGSAHWVSANGETGFQLDQSGDFDDVF